MKKWIFYIILFVISLYTVAQNHQTLKSEFIPPAGYKRVSCIAGSFADFVQSLPLKTENNIKSATGGEIHNSLYKVWAVIDLPLLFKTDIEQCADFGMRIWAEYHKQNKKLNDLYLFDYSGNKVYFKNQNKDYKGFLQHTFVYSNSSSLKNGCVTVKENELQPGDMFVQNQNGGIGHVSMIVDICKNANGEKLYLVGYSFMPAQEFHIEKAESGYGKEGWFTLEGYKKYLKENLDFGPAVFKRFQ